MNATENEQPQEMSEFEQYLRSLNPVVYIRNPKSPIIFFCDDWLEILEQGEGLWTPEDIERLKNQYLKS